MKKFLLLLMMWFAATSLMAQPNTLHVSGTVTDSVSGNPVANYPVHIDIDSAGGFFYHNEVHTATNGFYVDTIFFQNGNIPNGIVRVSVWDCMVHLRYTDFAFGPGNLNFTKNFNICVGAPPPPCHADFYPLFSPPPSLAVHYINTSTGSTGPWSWQFGDGAASGDTNPWHTYAAPGNYNVTLNMGDSLAGGCYGIQSHLIHVGDSTHGGCHAEFTWFCDSNMMLKTVHFINQSVGGGTWQWSFGDSTFSNEENPTHLFPNNGVFHVCLTISSTNPQCTDTRCHEVPVGPPPPPGCQSWFTHMPNWLNISFEGHMPLDAPATYTWSFGDSTGGSGKDVTHHYLAPGVYSVRLTTVLQDSSQCTFTSNQQIFVGDSTNIHQVYGQVFAGNFPLTFGMAMIFSDDTVPGGMPFIAASPLDSAGIYMFPYVPSGRYVIWALPFDSAGEYLPTFYVQALYWEQATKITLGQAQNPYNIHLLHATGMPVGSGGINGQVNTQGLKSSSVDQIAMILTDEQGNAIGFRKVNASGTFDFSAMAYGTYYLKPELPNFTSDLVKVVLSASKPVASVTLTFSSNGILGVNDISGSLESYMIYPNPASDVLNVSLKLSTSASPVAQIYNFSGQLVYSENFGLTKGENQIKLNVGSLTTGMYTLRIISSGGIMISQKIMIMR
jgi:PKD repeat protein